MAQKTQTPAEADSFFWRIDFQLLRVFRVVMHHRQLTAAAREIGVTQSALSHALKRLSDILGQPLFYRTRNGMQPTRYAETIAQRVEEVLKAAEAAFGAPTDFSPNAGTVFRISAVGEMATVFAAGTSAVAEAGNARLELMSVDIGAAFTAILHGRSDIALWPGVIDDPRLERFLVMSTPWVVAARKEHPVFTRKKDMSLRKYLACRHVALDTPDQDLAAHTFVSSGLERQVGVVAPNAITALQVAAESDFLATVPKALAQPFAKTRNLRLMQSPVELPPYAVFASWLKARGSDPMLTFLKEHLNAAPHRQEDGEADE